MKRTFESELPEGYHAIYEIDAKNKKTAVLLNIAALAVAAICIYLSFLIVRPLNFFENYSLARAVVFIAAMLVYIVLHELVHGAAYKILTKQKLTFGLTLSVAYCGVPNIYVYRRTALIALLAPFVLFIPVFLLPAIFLPDAWDKLYSLILLSLHLSGCSGDIYDAFLYLFRFKDETVLMRDTGPKQTFYVKNTTID